MVFTHLPSAIILALIPAPSSLGLTVFFLAARSSIASMDQAPRSTFLSAIMLPHERTAVMGIVNVVKTFSQSGGPVITGVLSNRGKFWVAFVVAGALKASYDLGLLTVFLGANLKRGDEQATETAPAEGNQAGEHGVESRDTRTIPGEASVISIVENRRGTKPILI
jgi:MFS family permease